MPFSPTAAAEQIRAASLRICEGLQTALCEKLPATFATVTAESEVLEREELRRLRSTGTVEELPGDFEDYARTSRQIYEDCLNTAQQMLLNGGAVILYHALEQLCISVLRRHLLSAGERYQAEFFCVGEMARRLKTFGVHCEGFSSWPLIEELRLVSNVVKHAQGKASLELRRSRPDLFRDADRVSDFGLERVEPEDAIYDAMTGEHFVLQLADLRRYFEAVCAFLESLATELELLAAHH